jgi:hypothetical protein
VKQRIRIDHASNRAAFEGEPPGLDDCVPLVRGLCTAMAGSQPTGHTVERCPDLVRMANAVRAERSDNEAASGSVVNDAVVPQQQECLLNRLSGHTVGLGEFILDKAGICGQPSLRYFREDGGVNKPNELVAIRRLWRLFAGTHFR